MSIIKPLDLLQKMFAIRKDGKPRRGVSTGFLSIDDLMLLNKRKLMIVTGIPGQGKTEFLDALAMNTSLLHGWKWCYFSPESDPAEGDHLQNIVVRRLGRRLSVSTEDEIREATKWAQNYYSWINVDGAASTIENILELAAERIVMGEEIDVLCIDPWNQMNHARQHNMRDDIYIGDCLTKVAVFEKNYDCLVVIVVHPHSVAKNKDGTYPIINVRECNGGITWYAKADYAICVNRPSPTKHGANIYIQKVKTKFIGRTGEAFLDYEPDGGRFKDTFAPDFSLPDAVAELGPPPFERRECEQLIISPADIATIPRDCCQVRASRGWRPSNPFGSD